MSILVVGSVALDTVETPFGDASDVLGGSAAYFSLAASLFTDVKAVAVVGEDFDDSHLELLKSRGVDIKGIKKAPGETFRWHCKYGYDLGDPETLGTYLNVFEKFNPVIPEDYKDADCVFLANIDPEIQLNLLQQVNNPRLIACDTMNYWIQNKPKELREVLNRIHILIINDSETRELTGEPRMMKAARAVLDMGPEILIVKRGEYGALMFSKKGIFWAPSYPLDEVIDPTGAGDSFAGGFMGHLVNENYPEMIGIKRSVVNGCVIASFTVEDFSVKRLANLTQAEVGARFSTFMNLSKFD